MPYINYVPGLPGLKTARTATPRRILRGGEWQFLPGSAAIIDGAESRDSGNTGDLDVLRPGLLMGLITSSGKYAPSLVGVNQSAYTSGGTSITVTAAQAVEIVRRVGSSGSLLWIGPPSAAGVVAVLGPISYSAIDTGTGVITTTSLGANLIAGGFAAVNDGTYLPRTMIPDWMNGYGIQVTDSEGTDLDVEFPQLPTGCSGAIDASQLLPTWPSDSSLQNWIRDTLRTYGNFVLDDAYVQ